MITRIYLRPNMSFSNQAGIIASPIASCPTRTLIQELDVVFQGRFDLTLHVILNPCLPTVRNQPTWDKVVIVGIEMVFTPTFGLEAFQEQWALENFRSQHDCASRHARSSTVHSMCRWNLKISSFNVCCTQPIIHDIRNWTRSNTLYPLTWSNSTYFAVLEWRQ